MNRRDRPDRSLVLDAFRRLLKDDPPGYRYVWRIADPQKVQMQGKHHPSQWDRYQARVQARLTKVG